MDCRRSSEKQRVRDDRRAPDVTDEVRITVEDMGSIKAFMDEEGHKQLDQQLKQRPTLTGREIQSVAAIVDTFLPSAPVPPKGSTVPRDRESLEAFYRTSGTMIGAHETAATCFAWKLQHPMRPLIRVGLWFLSTWYGTLVICGWRSLSTSFPFVRSFPEIEPRERREQVLLGLATSPIPLFRLLFRGLKFIILLIYFSELDEKNQNASWKALGYSGPDPDFAAGRSEQNQGQVKKGGEEDPDTLPQDQDEEKAQYGPLYDSLVHLDRPRVCIAAALGRAGIPISFDSSTTTKKALPTIRCDAVIVGSGSGGGVAAGVLAAAGYKVVVLEKGGYRARRGLTLLERDALDTMYEASGLLASDDIGVTFLAGATVGGGSAINWSASIRPPEHVLREWAGEKGLRVFRSEAFLEGQEAVCARMGVQGEVVEHGMGGEVVKCGCQKLGWPVQDVPRNAPPEHTCGWCCFGCKDGMKKGTSETWLVDAVKSGNAVVLPECRAVKVVTKQRKGKRSVAGGVIFEYIGGDGNEGDGYFIEATATVVAGGALNTPKLLRRSGLKNKHIGRNLRAHPVVMAWGTFLDEKQGTTAAGAKLDCSKTLVNKNCYEGEILTAMSTIVSNAGTTGYGALIQTPALHPGMFAALMPWISSADFRHRMTSYSRTAHLFALGRDNGPGGSVNAGSISYKLGRDDVKNLRAGLEAALRILAAAGAAEIGTQQWHGRRLDVRAAGEGELDRFVKEESAKAVGIGNGPVCSAHQMGSCRMGATEAEGAVNERGETWEVEGLFVADASVLPTAVGVNPMVTIMATAYCTAQVVKDMLHRSPRKVGGGGGVGC